MQRNSQASSRDEQPSWKSAARKAARHRGPPLIWLASVYAALVVSSIVVPMAMAGGAHFPSPFDPGALRWFGDHPSAALASAFFLFGSAVPLGLFAATASSRVQFLGMKVAGIQIALFGGIAASVALASSAFAAWTLAQPGIAEQVSVGHALHLFAFAAGGPGFAVPFGLLVAGISLVAGLQGFLPAWLMKAGLVLAALAELAVFAFVWQPTHFLLPIARFGGLAWLIATGLLLPDSRLGARHGAGAPSLTPGSALSGGQA